MVIRTATRADVDALGRLGALLMTVHYDFDRRRFLEPDQHSAAGYGQYLGSQLDDKDSVIFVAELDGNIVGYCYCVIEPLSWKELRDEAGFISDLALDPHARRQGAGTRLVEAAVAWFRDRKLARVMLWTSTENDPARQLFQRAGFRPTMLEMTLDLEGTINA
jgi:ribosomal protein S18 acetylase RimI-like enzyme